MIDVELNKDVREAEPALIAGLTARQTICGVVAVAIVGGAYYLLKDFLPIEIVVAIAVIPALPVVLAGFFKMHGQAFEDFAMNLLKDMVINGKSRRNQSSLPDVVVEQAADKARIKELQGKKDRGSKKELKFLQAKVQQKGKPKQSKKIFKIQKAYRNKVMD